jgi:hypothetical protein
MGFWMEWTIFRLMTVIAVIINLSIGKQSNDGTSNGSGLSRP